MAAMNGNGNDYNEEAVLAREMQYAQHASDILNNPLFAECFEIVANQIMDHWRATQSNDVAGREDDHKELRALWRVKVRLMNMISSGTLADSHMRAEVNKRRES